MNELLERIVSADVALMIILAVALVKALAKAVFEAPEVTKSPRATKVMEWVNFMGSVGLALVAVPLGAYVLWGQEAIGLTLVITIIGTLLFVVFVGLIQASDPNRIP